VSRTGIDQGLQNGERDSDDEKEPEDEVAEPG
jgi:hypothetical protein